MRTASSRNEQYAVAKHAMLQLGVLLAVVVSGPTTDSAQMATLFWGMRGPLAAVQSLSLFVVVRAFNPQIAAHGQFSGLLSWGLPLLISARMLPLMSGECLRTLIPLWVFCAVVAVCSMIASPAPDVSLMKAATLAFVATGVVTATQRLTYAEVRDAGTWFRTLAVVVAIASVATLARPSAAFMPNTRLLTGIFNQSQWLGTFLAPFSAASLAQWMLMRNSVTPARALAWAAIVGCMVLTFSRTAAVAAVLGLALSLIGGKSAGSGEFSTRVRRASIVIGLLSLGLIILELTTANVMSNASQFVLKGGQTSIRSAFEASRGELIAEQLRNFSNSPWLGNGFGVYADGEFPSGVKTFMGIPVSAPVEKGVLPTAVLEESGVLGFVCFGALIYSLVSSVWRRAPTAVVATLFAALFVNLGEAVLLSPGGMGLHIWLLIGWCLRAAQVSAAPVPAVAAPAAGEPQGGPPRRPFPNLLD